MIFILSSVGFEGNKVGSIDILIDLINMRERERERERERDRSSYFIWTAVVGALNLVPYL